MALKPFQTQDGIRILNGQSIVDQDGNPIVGSGSTLMAGTDAESDYWLSQLNGYQTDKATVVSCVITEGEPPVVVLNGKQPTADGASVNIHGAEGLLSLNSSWNLKSTGNTNEYQLYTNQDFTSFLDLYGLGTYTDNTASLTYYGLWAYALATAFDADGNVYAIGNGGTQYTGYEEAFVTKYTPKGAIVWQKALSEESNVYGWGLAVGTEGTVYVAANTGGGTNHVHVLCLSTTDGSVVWQKFYNATNNSAVFSLEITTDGELVVAGEVYDSNTNYDFMVAKINHSTGDVIWSRNLGGWFDQEAYGLGIDPNGYIVVCGYTEQESGPRKALIYKMDNLGNVVWQKSVYNPEDYDATGCDVAVNAQGSIFMVSNFDSNDGTVVIFTLMNSSGEIEWSKKAGPGTCGSAAVSCCVGSDGKFYAMAQTSIEVENNTWRWDTVLARFHVDSTCEWQRYWSNPQYWMLASDVEPSGQAIAVHGEFMAVAGWQWYVPRGDWPSYNAIATVSKLPSDGHVMSIGANRLRESTFIADTISLTSETSNLPYAALVLTTSPGDMTVSTGTLLANLEQDWPTAEHEWRGNTDGSFDMAGGLRVTNTPWSEDIWIGEEIMFVRNNYGDEQDHIDEGLILTRLSNPNGNAGGLFNAASEDTYDMNVSPAGTEWNSEGWSDLSNVKDREYTDWRSAVYPPNVQPGKELIMHDTINDKYYTIKFMSWQPWGYGGGFSYVRRQINTSAYFTKTPYGSEIDYIDVGLSLTRDSNGPLYNPAAGETEYDDNWYTSPKNTLWNGDGWDNLENLRSRQWLYFQESMVYNIKNTIMGREWVMWDTNNNQYYAIKFTQWQPGNNGGGVKYIRRKINKAHITHGIRFPDGTVQTTAFNNKSAGIIPQVIYDESDDRWLNIDDIGKHIVVTQSNTYLYIPDRGSQPWVVGATITIVNKSGGDIFVSKDNDYENGNIYGAGTSDSNTQWTIPDLGGWNICTLMCVEIYGYDNPTVNWVLSGPGIST